MKGLLLKVAGVVLLCLSGFLALYFGALMYDAYCQRESLGEKTEALNRRIEAYVADNDYKRAYHERLANDEEFAARVIRETLGYVGEREIVFKFDESQFSPKTGRGVTVESHPDGEGGTK